MKSRILKKHFVQNQTNDKNLLENKPTKLAFGSDILSNFYYSLKMRVTSPMISTYQLFFLIELTTYIKLHKFDGLFKAIRTKPNNQVITIIEFSSSGKASSTKENDNHGKARIYLIQFASR
ncbi:unnamed protein product [Rhizophagus irregularis]|nr:unnamed protein product [Rhizophagus irregularis]